MISIRIIYRLIEFSADGSEQSSAAIEALSTQEAWFFVLEAMPMLVALIGFGVCHPRRGMVGVDATIPRGWLGRKCEGGCCGGRDKGRMGEKGERKGRERLGSFEGDEVMLVARHR
jgi:hypothetical protein